MDSPALEPRAWKNTVSQSVVLVSFPAIELSVHAVAAEAMAARLGEVRKRAH